MNYSLATFIKHFFSHYLPVQKGLSSNTIETYRDGIKLLLCYASDVLPKPVDELFVEDVSEALVLDFLEYLEQERNCSSTTRNLRLAAIRSLFAFIARREPALIAQSQQIRSIPKKRSKHKLINYLDENEMQSVLGGIDINARTGVRDKALLLILYNTGARVSEIVNLTLDDIQLGDAPQVKLLGKGQKERSCPLWPETVNALKQYLQKRQPINDKNESVFLNANGLAITRFGIRYITRKLDTQTLSATEKHLNPHVIRHNPEYRIMPSCC